MGGAVAEEVEQTAGRGGEHVDAALKVLALLSVAHHAVDDGGREVRVLGELLEGLFHLQRELAGRLEDKAAHFAVRAELVENREREGRGLARAGLGRADDVLAGEDHGDGLSLNRGRVGIAHFGDRKSESVIQAELGERVVLRRDHDRRDRLDRGGGRVLEGRITEGTLRALAAAGAAATKAGATAAGVATGPLAPATATAAGEGPTLARCRIALALGASAFAATTATAALATLARFARGAGRAVRLGLGPGAAGGTGSALTACVRAGG